MLASNVVICSRMDQDVVGIVRVVTMVSVFLFVDDVAVAAGLSVFDGAGIDVGANAVVAVVGAVVGGVAVVGGIVGIVVDEVSMVVDVGVVSPSVIVVDGIGGLLGALEALGTNISETLGAGAGMVVVASASVVVAGILLVGTASGRCVEAGNGSGDVAFGDCTRGGLVFAQPAALITQDEQIVHSPRTSLCAS